VFMLYALGFRVHGLGCRAYSLWFTISGSGFRVWGLGFMNYD